MKVKLLDLGGWGYSSKTFQTPGHDVNYLMAHMTIPIKLSLIDYQERLWIITMGQDKLVVQLL